MKFWKKYIFLLICCTLHMKISDATVNKKTTNENEQSRSAVPLIELGGNSYYFETNIRTNWFAASEFCRRFDLYLVAIESAEENLLLMEHARSIGLPHGLWTSGSDLAAWGSYVWSSTGRNVIFSDWADPEPEHLGDCDTERAIAMRSMHKFHWGDLPSSNEMHFICEKINATSIFDETSDDEEYSDDSDLDPDWLSPLPMVELGGTYYYFETNLRVNWFAAHDFCRRFGLHLTAVETAEENLLIQGQIGVLGVTWDLWTSGSDLAVPGAYVWSSTGRNMIYADWGTGEPKHEGTCNGTTQAIAYTASQGFRWADHSPYSHLAHFVCEQF